MKRLIGIVPPLLVAVAFGAMQTPKWAELRSSAGRFSIQMPAKATEQVQPVDTAAGKVQLHMFIATLGSAAYFACYSDYDAKLMAKASPTKVLEGCRDGMVRNQNGTLKSDSAIQTAGVGGRSFTWETATGFAGEARIYMKGNRLYQVMIMQPKGTGNASNASKFFGSFRML